MNKTIIKLSIEIFAAIFIAFFSYNIFNQGSTVSQAVAYNSGNKEVTLKEIKPLELSNIFPMDNEYALDNYEKAQYKIINNGTKEVNYRIIYRISNDIDYNWFNYYLKIDNNENTNKFEDQQKRQTIDYTDIILYEGKLEVNKTVDYEYLMWLDSSIGNEAQNKSFKGEFVIETY